ncbi:MAG: chromosome segregation protein SMC [Patescibacteria group bacterium]|nr:MAG: chromosome segregation protein SMC [Patescibacteria group bacterium]
MKLKSLRLKDFGCFVDQVIEFQPGLNVIVGPNGSGKSTILDGIYLALYCESIDRNAYTRYGSTVGELTLDIESDGIIYTILRRFYTESTGFVARLSFSDNRPSISGLTRMRNFLFENVYHLPTGAIPWYLRQGEVHRFASAFDTEVVDLLRFLGFGKLSPIKQSLDNYLKERFGQVEQKHIEAVTNLCITRSQITETLNEKEALEREQIFEKKRILAQRINQFEDQLKLYQVYNRYRNFQQRYQQAISKKAYLEELITETTASLQSVEAVLFDIRRKILGEEQAHSVSDGDVQQTFTSLEVQKNLYDKTVSDYQQVVTGYLNNFRRRPAPCRRVLARTVSELAVVKDKLDQYSRLGILDSSFEGGQCPFCGNAISVEHLSQMRSEYFRCKSRLQELTDVHTRLVTQQTVRSNIRKQCSEFYQMKKFLKSQLQMFRPELFVHLNLKPSFLDYYQKKQQLQNQLVSLQNSLNNVVEELNSVESSLAAFTGYDFSSINPDVSADVLQSQLNDCYRQHAELSQKENRYTQVKNRLEELTQLEVSIQNQVTKLERDVRHKRLARSLIAEMEDQAPAVASEYIQQVILPAINVFLRELRSPFLLRYRSVFYVEFDDGKELPVSRLSYGQRTVLSIVAAYAFYIHSLSRSILLADEPLANLDVDNADAVVKFLNRLHDYSLNKQIQCIISSHQISDVSGCAYHIIHL